MNDELDKALEWADWINGVGYEVPKIISAKKGAEILAIAVRSLRETVKAREEEIDRLKVAIEIVGIQLDEFKQLHGVAVNPSLDRALNENDGVYKP